jgi:hypothetical protein
MRTAVCDFFAQHFDIVGRINSHPYGVPRDAHDLDRNIEMRESNALMFFS